MATAKENIKGKWKRNSGEGNPKRPAMDLEEFTMGRPEITARRPPEVWLGVTSQAWPGTMSQARPVAAAPAWPVAADPAWPKVIIKAQPEAASKARLEIVVKARPIMLDLFARDSWQLRCIEGRSARCGRCPWRAQLRSAAFSCALPVRRR